MSEGGWQVNQSAGLCSLLMYAMCRFLITLLNEVRKVSILDALVHLSDPSTAWLSMKIAVFGGASSVTRQSAKSSVS